MPECEICGREISSGKRIEIDGSILSVCQECVPLGKEVAEARVVMPHRRRREDDSFIDKVSETEKQHRDFPKQIRVRREGLNMSQEDFAKKLYINFSLLKRIESGFIPDEQMIRRIKKYL